MNLLKKPILAGALMLSAVAAQAIPMEGGVSFVGFGGGPFLPGEDTTTATEFDFPETENAFATDVTGDFVGLIDIFSGPGDTYDLFTFHDFAFDPLTPDTLVWDSDDVDLAFFLDSVTVSRSSDTLELSGSGRLKDTATLEESSGLWNITVNEKGGSFSWSSSTEIVGDVAEPGLLALLGFGVAGMSLARRKKGAA